MNHLATLTEVRRRSESAVNQPVRRRVRGLEVRRVGHAVEAPEPSEELRVFLAGVPQLVNRCRQSGLVLGGRP